jgi:hypothetical protein
MSSGGVSTVRSFTGRTSLEPPGGLCLLRPSASAQGGPTAHGGPLGHIRPRGASPCSAFPLDSILADRIDHPVAGPPGVGGNP